MTNRINQIIKSVSSNFIRAQQNENGDITLRNRYLEKASMDSIILAQLLQKENNIFESSRYLLSAATAFEKACAINQAKACYIKIIELNHPDFVKKAKSRKDKLVKIIEKELDITTKEGRINALGYLVWKSSGLTTTMAIDAFSEEFSLDLQTYQIREYAKELEQRKRVSIWGGPSGREYHIYPNIADLASRSEYYGHKTLIEGTIGRRITQEFQINFQNWNYNKELFIINGSIIPEMVITVDMDAFVKYLRKFASPGLNLSAFGLLGDFKDLAGNGYESNQDITRLDVVDSERLIDNITGEALYNRAG